MYYLMSMGFCFSQAAAATVEEVVPFGEAPPAGDELDAAPSSDTELRRFDDLLRRAGGVTSSPFSNRIHGGRDAVKGEVPFHVSLRSTAEGTKGLHYCSGSLIAERWVLTAGSCLSHGVGEFVVRVGGRDYAAKRQIQHPQYHYTRHNDIGLIELAEPASGHTTIQLARKDQVKDGMTVTTAGLGRKKYGGYWNNLQVLEDNQVIPLVTCSSAYNKLPPRPFTPHKLQTDGTIMCAGTPKREDACQEDTGAPLFKKVDGKFILMGITSWGRGCDAVEVPGVYTFVPPGVYTFVPTYTSWVKKYVPAPRPARPACRKYEDRSAVQSRAGRAKDHPTTFSAKDCEARCVKDANCYLYTWVFLGWPSFHLPGYPPHLPFYYDPYEWNFKCVMWSKAKAEKEGRARPGSFVVKKGSTSGICPTEEEKCQSSHCTGDWKLKTTPTYCESPTCPPNTSVCCNYEGSRLKPGETIEVVKTGNCESNGFEFIKSREDCKVAGRLVGITSQNSLNNANPGGGNRVKYCGTFGGLQYLHFNSHAGRQNANRESYQLCKGTTIVSDIDGDCLKWKGVEEGEGSYDTCMPFCEADSDCIGIQTDSEFEANCELVSSSSKPITSCGRGDFTFYPKSRGVSTEYKYAGCFKSRWDRSKTRDVATTAAGVQECRDLCKAAGFKYFGFECPHKGLFGTEVHCECGQTLNEGERVDDGKCREFNKASGKHCTGPFTVEGYSLGAGSLNSAYRV